MDSPIVHMISNVLSTLTIMSCLFLKVPQILQIQEKKSAEGIYIQAMLLEITSFTIVTLYNFTNKYGLLTYLEFPIILLQIYVMLYFVLKYKKQLDGQVVPTAMVAYLGLIVGFATEMLPKFLLSYMLPFCTPISGFAKVTYIYGMVRARNADAVSLTTWIITVSANLARLFTVFVDSGDMTLMCNFLISAVLNISVLLTAVYYQRFYCAPEKDAGERKRRRSRQTSHTHDD